MNKPLVISAIFAAAIAAQAPAQPPQGDVTRQQAEDRARRLFETLDLNHDGVVTRAEAEQAVAQLQDRRGTAAGEAAKGLGGVRRLARAFAGVESITLKQFEQLMLKRFDRMDLNHDGVVTAAERSQARANRDRAQ